MSTINEIMKDLPDPEKKDTQPAVHTQDNATGTEPPDIPGCTPRGSDGGPDRCV